MSQVRKVTITYYCEDFDVEVIREEVVELFVSSDAALYRRAGHFTDTPAPPSEISEDMQAFFAFGKEEL